MHPFTATYNCWQLISTKMWVEMLGRLEVSRDFLHKFINYQTNYFDRLNKFFASIHWLRVLIALVEQAVRAFVKVSLRTGLRNETQQRFIEVNNFWIEKSLILISLIRTYNLTIHEDQLTASKLHEIWMKRRIHVAQRRSLCSIQRSHRDDRTSDAERWICQLLEPINRVNLYNLLFWGTRMQVS